MPDGYTTSYKPPSTHYGQYHDLIDQAGQDFDVDPDLISSFMGQESSGNSHAVSSKGASGLMQLTPDTARGLGVSNIFDPQQNIQGGAKYIAQLREKYGDDLNTIAAAYNAGPGTVDKYGRDVNKWPGYHETKNYVPSINQRYAKYRGGTGQQTKQASNPFLAALDEPDQTSSNKTGSSNPFLAALDEPATKIPIKPAAPSYQQTNDAFKKKYGRSIEDQQAGQFGMDANEVQAFQKKYGYHPFANYIYGDARPDNVKFTDQGLYNQLQSFLATQRQKEANPETFVNHDALETGASLLREQMNPIGSALGRAYDATIGGQGLKAFDPSSRSASDQAGHGANLASGFTSGQSDKFINYALGGNEQNGTLNAPTTKIDDIQTGNNIADTAINTARELLKPENTYRFAGEVAQMVEVGNALGALGGLAGKAGEYIKAASKVGSRGEQGAMYLDKARRILGALKEGEEATKAEKALHTGIFFGAQSGIRDPQGDESRVGNIAKGFANGVIGGTFNNALASLRGAKPTPNFIIDSASEALGFTVPQAAEIYYKGTQAGKSNDEIIADIAKTGLDNLGFSAGFRLQSGHGFNEPPNQLSEVLKRSAKTSDDPNLSTGQRLYSKFDNIASSLKNYITEPRNEPGAPNTPFAEPKPLSQSISSMSDADLVNRKAELSQVMKLVSDPKATKDPVMMHKIVDAGAELNMINKEQAQRKQGAVPSSIIKPTVTSSETPMTADVKSLPNMSDDEINQQIQSVRSQYDKLQNDAANHLNTAQDRARLRTQYQSLDNEMKRRLASRQVDPAKLQMDIEDKNNEIGDLIQANNILGNNHPDLAKNQARIRELAAQIDELENQKANLPKFESTNTVQTANKIAQDASQGDNYVNEFGIGRSHTDTSNRQLNQLANELNLSPSDRLEMNQLHQQANTNPVTNLHIEENIKPTFENAQSGTKPASYAKAEFVNIAGANNGYGNPLHTNELIGRQADIIREEVGNLIKPGESDVHLHQSGLGVEAIAPGVPKQALAEALQRAQDRIQTEVIDKYGLNKVANPKLPTDPSAINKSGGGIEFSVGDVKKGVSYEDTKKQAISQIEAKYSDRAQRLGITPENVSTDHKPTLVDRGVTPDYLSRTTPVVKEGDAFETPIDIMARKAGELINSLAERGKSGKIIRNITEAAQRKILKAYESFLLKDQLLGKHGFLGPAEREYTMRRAIEHTDKTGEPSQYVEFDIRNVGGLNAYFKKLMGSEKLGFEAADRTIAKFAEIINKRINERSLKAKVTLFRHGGDELSAIVVGAKTGELKDALKLAESDIDAYVKSEGLNEIEHPKKSLPGTGIITGIAEVKRDRNATPDQIQKRVEEVLGEGGSAVEEVKAILKKKYKEQLAEKAAKEKQSQVSSPKTIAGKKAIRSKLITTPDYFDFSAKKGVSDEQREQITESGDRTPLRGSATPTSPSDGNTEPVESKPVSATNTERSGASSDTTKTPVTEGSEAEPVVNNRSIQKPGTETSGTTDTEPNTTGNVSASPIKEPIPTKTPTITPTEGDEPVSPSEPPTKELSKNPQEIAQKPTLELKKMMETVKKVIPRVSDDRAAEIASNMLDKSKREATEKLNKLFDGQTLSSADSVDVARLLNQQADDGLITRQMKPNGKGEKVVSWLVKDNDGNTKEITIKNSKLVVGEPTGEAVTKSGNPAPTTLENRAMVKLWRKSRLTPEENEALENYLDRAAKLETSQVKLTQDGIDNTLTEGTRVKTWEVSVSNGDKVIINNHKGILEIERVIKPSSSPTAKKVEETKDLAPNTEKTEAKTEMFGKKIPQAQGKKELIEALKTKIANGEKIKDPTALYKIAAEHLTGKVHADYSAQDVYNQLEGAVNAHLLDLLPTLDGKTPEEKLEAMRKVTESLPTQYDRSTEKVKQQAFSTPPPLAFVASEAANIKKGDTVLEPSGGTNSLGVFAQAKGAELHLNELDPERAQVSANMGVKNLSNHDASQINDRLDDSVKPDVVLMNPPFSSDVKANKNDPLVAARHVESGLQRLNDGGRLVAIVGRGMSLESPTYKDFFDGILKDYNLRANLSIDGSEYKKYGTTFDNRLLVFDKNGPTDRSKIIKGSDNLSLDEVLKKIGELNDRPENDTTNPTEDPNTPPPTTSEGVKAPTDMGGTEGDIQRSLRDTKGLASQGAKPPRQRRSRPNSVDNSENKGTTEPTDVGDGISTGQPPVQSSEPTEGEQTTGSGSVGDNNEQSLNTEANVEGTKVPEPDPEPIQDPDPPVTSPTPTAREEIGAFITYQAPFASLSPHEGNIVETKSMAGVQAPIIDPQNMGLHPELMKLWKTGKLSDLQMENVVRAHIAHNQTLPDGSSAGYFIGDGTGVGKGRQVGGIIYHNWLQGRRKAVWFSVKPGLIGDARRDFEDLGIKELIPLKLFTDIPPGDDPNKHIGDGVMFVSYKSLLGGERKQGGQTRLEQLAKWLGAGPDAQSVLLMDEVHKASNLDVDDGSDNYMSAGGSQSAEAVNLIQNKLPKAKVTYVSATGASEVKDLAIMPRLGLWGKGTEFPNGFSQFMSEINEGGLGAMEQVAQDLKALGKYQSRALSFKGTEFNEVTHDLTPSQEKMYNMAADAWNYLMHNTNAAIKVTGNSAMAKRNALTAFWGAHQRFFRSLGLSMKLPTLLNEIRASLEKENPEQVVVSLVETRDASAKREEARIKDAGLSYDEMDFTPRQILGDYLKNAFPVEVYEEVEGENGKTRIQKALDVNGKPLINKEAEKRRNDVLAHIEKIFSGDFALPDNPIDTILRTFGADQVAEVTGRDSQYLINPVTGRVEPRKLPDRNAEMRAFQAGQKRIAIISEAGGTGFSFHASSKNPIEGQARRHHIVFELGWNAENLLQALGRTHRTNQASAPKYTLLSTNIGGEKRFSSTAASRLADLGALTKGERTAGGAVDLSKHNFTGAEGGIAVSKTYSQLADIDRLSPELKDDLKSSDIHPLQGMQILDKEGAISKGKEQSVNTFFNRILGLPIRQQQAVFKMFTDNFETAVITSKEAGTFDDGTSEIKANHVELGAPSVIATDPTTGAETKHYKAVLDLPNNKLPYEKLEDTLRWRPTYPQDGFYQRKQGAVVYLSETSSYKDEEGNPVRRFNSYRPSNGLEDRIYKHADVAGYKPLSRAVGQALWAEQLEKTPDSRTEEYHILSGAVLPIWRRLRTAIAQASKHGSMKTVKISDSNTGEQVVGQHIPDQALDTVLATLGVDQKGKLSSPDYALEKLNGSGGPVRLEGDMFLHPVKRSGSDLVELSSIYGGGFSRAESERLSKMGMRSERQGYLERFYLPTDPTEAKNVLGKLLTDNPIKGAQAIKLDNQPVNKKGGMAKDNQVEANANQKNKKQLKFYQVKEPIGVEGLTREKLWNSLIAHPLEDGKGRKLSYSEGIKVADNALYVMDSFAKSFGKDLGSWYKETFAGVKSEGQKLVKGKPAQGATEFLKNGQALLHLYQGADPSTLIHEFFHIARRQLTEPELNTLESSVEKAGLPKVVDHDWQQEHEEYIARAGENMFKSGQLPPEAPSKLREVFNKVGGWMKDVYERLGNFKIPLSKTISKFFDDIQFDEPSRNVFQDRFNRGAQALEDESGTLPSETEVKAARENGGYSILGEGKQKLRSVPETARPLMSQEQSAKTPSMGYQELHNSQVEEAARGLIANNPDEAQRLANQEMDDSGVLGNQVAIELYKKAQAEGDFGQAKQLLSKLAIRGTKLGQAVQILAQLSRSTPDGVVAYAHKLIENAGEKVSPSARNQTNHLTKKLSEMINALEASAPVKEAVIKFFQTNPVPSKLRKSIIDSVIPGAPKDAQIQIIRDAIAKHNGIPTLSNEVASQLYDLAKEAEAAQSDREEAIAQGKINKLIGEQIPSSFGTKLATYTTYAKLLNLSTAGKYAVGHGSFPVLETAKDVVKAGLDYGVSKVTGKRTAVLPELGSQLRNAKNAASTRYEDVKLGIDTTSDRIKPLLFRSSVGKAVEKVYNGIYSILPHAIEQSGYQESLRNQMKAAKVSAPTPEMEAIAKQEGLERAFQDKSLLANVANGVKRALNGGKEFGAGDVLLKFATVPANLISRGVEYSGGGFIRAAYELSRPLAGKEFRQRRFVDTLARGLTGSVGLVGAAAWLAHKGVLIQKPKDDKLAQILAESGVSGNVINWTGLNRLANGQDPTLKKGDVVSKFDSIEPVGFMMNVGLGIGSEANKDSQSAISSMAKGWIEGIDSSLGEDKIIQTLAQPLGDYRSGKDKSIIKAGENFATKIPGLFIPTLIQQARTFSDPSYRDEVSDSAFGKVVNNVMNQLPGLSNKLPIKMNQFGQDRNNKRAEGDIPGLADSFTNFPKFSTYNPTNAQAYAKSLREEVGDSEKGYLPPKTPNKLNINDEKILLSPEQKRSYAKYTGKNSEDLYNQLSKDQAFNKLPSDVKASAIKEQVTNIKEKAKVDLFADKPSNLKEIKKKPIISNQADIDHNAKVDAEVKENISSLPTRKGWAEIYNSLPKDKQKEVKRRIQSLYNRAYIDDGLSGTEGNIGRIQSKQVYNAIKPGIEIPMILRDVKYEREEE